MISTNFRKLTANLCENSKQYHLIQLWKKTGKLLMLAELINILFMIHYVCINIDIVYIYVYRKLKQWVIRKHTETHNATNVHLFKANEYHPKYINWLWFEIVYICVLFEDMYKGSRCKDSSRKISTTTQVAPSLYYNNIQTL